MTEGQFLQTQQLKSLQEGNSITTLKLVKEQNQHEKAVLERKMGWLGRFFGTEENSSKNITAFLCAILIVFALGVSLGAYFGKGDAAFAKWIWGAILPIISLSLGYLFGKK